MSTDSIAVFPAARCSRWASSREVRDEPPLAEGFHAHRAADRDLDPPILVRVSLPAHKGIQRDAVATQALGDFNTVKRRGRGAVRSHRRAYAEDGPAGVVPAGMSPFLPRNHSFTKEQYSLDWENFSIADSTMGPGQSGYVLALTITANDSLGTADPAHGRGEHARTGRSRTRTRSSCSRRSTRRTGFRASPGVRDGGAVAPGAPVPAVRGHAREAEPQRARAGSSRP